MRYYCNNVRIKSDKTQYKSKYWWWILGMYFCWLGTSVKSCESSRKKNRCLLSNTDGLFSRRDVRIAAASRRVRPSPWFDACSTQSVVAEPRPQPGRKTIHFELLVMFIFPIFQDRRSKSWFIGRPPDNNKSETLPRNQNSSKRSTTNRTPKFQRVIEVHSSSILWPIVRTWNIVWNLNPKFL